MNADQHEGTSGIAIAEAAVKPKRKGLSIVWLVPIVAALIGAGLVYKAVTEKGPTITITFQNAEGLEAGKTKVKYKDVEIGEVEHIGVGDDLGHVVVTAQLAKGCEPYLTTRTQFWVVRARVSAGSISGLGTIFSGAYIGMDPGLEGAPAIEFKGLEIPPVLTDKDPGQHFKLKAESLGSLDRNSPVYFRRIEVGKVVAYELEKEGRSVDIEIFVAAPFHEQVHQNTRFWNASGLDVTLDAKGVRVDTESFVSMMIGGIAFDIPPGTSPEGAAGEDAQFTLYPNRQAAFARTYTRRMQYLVYFGGSVRGLSPEAPVEFHGIQIGKVTDIKLEYHAETQDFKIPVLIEIEPDRIALVGTDDRIAQKKTLVPDFVEKGLRAQLKTGSMLTGKLFIDLDFHSEAPPVKAAWVGDRVVIPSVPATMETITAGVTKFLNKLQALPLEKITGDLDDTIRSTERLIDSADRLINSEELNESIRALNATLQGADRFVGSLNSRIAPEITATMERLKATLAAVESLVGGDSVLVLEMERAMTELAGAARAIRGLADYLERHPEALLKGKGKE